MSTIDLSVVLVHYRTPDLLRRAIGAIEQALQSSDLRAEIVVVDNSDDLPLGELAPHGLLRVLRPGENLGYAGAAQFAVSRTRAPWVLLMNCDVLVEPDCIGFLVGALQDQAAVVGPSLFWDEDLRVHLPPAEPRGRGAELALALTSRLPILAPALRNARRKHAQRHWMADEPLRSVSLSGCLLAFRRDTWLETGGMDREFQLYYEETDWLLRVAKAGHSVQYVPRARAVHLYDRSAAGEPAASRWYRDSARHFRTRHYGSAFTHLLERVSGGEAGDLSREMAPHARAPSMRIPQVAQGGWVELGAAPLGCPAAAERLPPESESWQLPEEIWNHLRPGHYTLAMVDQKGREHGLRLVARG